MLFAGIGEILGVTDAIGAFLIGLVLGATKYRNKIEHIAHPAAGRLRRLLLPQLRARAQPRAVPLVSSSRCSSPCVMTLVLNIAAGQFVAWINKLGSGRASTRP